MSTINRLMLLSFTILIILSTLLLVIEGESCEQVIPPDSVCVEDGQSCEGELNICNYGSTCLPNPYSNNGPITKTSLSVEENTSFEPIPHSICVKDANIGEACGQNVANCMAGLKCMSATGQNLSCQAMPHLQLGEECEFDQQCYQTLTCDPIQKICVADIPLYYQQAGHQCLGDIQCGFNYYCNTSLPQYRCQKVPGLGEPCDLYCESGLYCNNNGVTSTCISYFSLNEGDVCDPDFQLLNSLYSNIYIGTCKGDLVCSLESKICVKPTFSTTTFNCSNPASGNCTEQESCYCDRNGNGQCSPFMPTSVEVQTTCAQMMLDLVECTNENQCSFMLLGPLFYPGSCTMKHCHSTVCDLSKECSVFPSASAPICGYGTSFEWNTFGLCANFNNAAPQNISFVSTLILVLLSLLFL